MQKYIQMPTSFVTKTFLLLHHFLDNYELDDDARLTCNTLLSQFDAKIKAMNKRDAFSKYKSAMPGSIEREQFRKQYLDFAEIHRDWTSSNEVPYDCL